MIETKKEKFKINLNKKRKKIMYPSYISELSKSEVDEHYEKYKLNRFWNNSCTGDLGNKFAKETAITGVVVYLATAIFTSYNPVAVTTFAVAGLVGRYAIYDYFFSKEANIFTRVYGWNLNIALAVFATIKATPYVQEVIDFVVAELPSRPESVSAFFARVPNPFANLSFSDISVDSAKAFVSEHPTAIAFGVFALATILVISRKMRGNRNRSSFSVM